MKPRFDLSRWIVTGVICLTLTGMVRHGLAQGDYDICTFDTDWCQFTTANSPPPAVYYWTNFGNPAGSIYFVINWGWNPGGWQDTKVSWDFNWPGVDCRNYANVEFDVKIDRENSYPAADGTYGGVQVVAQGWAGWGGNPGGLEWVALGNVTLVNTDGWQRVSVPLARFPYNLSRLCLSFFGNPPSATTNTICYFVDNIRLTAPPAPPPSLTLKMESKPKVGLHLFTPVEGSMWQRQSIRTSEPVYGWYNSGAPTTYALTIADFPFISEVTTNYVWYYDVAAEVGSWWKWWGVDMSFTWDGTEPDAGGRCTNGSMYVVAGFTGAGGQQFSVVGSFAGQLDGSLHDALMFDIKVDPTSGPIRSGANYGTLDGIGFVAADWSQVNVGAYTIPLSATNWTRVILPINRSDPKLKGIRGVWLKMWSGDAHTNALKFWLDNIVVRGTPSTYQVHMYLAPGPNTGLPIAPDWNETNCLFVQIQMGQNGQAMAAVRYKTNYPNSNGGTNIVGYVTNADCTVTTLLDNYFGACVLATITNGPVLGTWSLIFHDNANATFSGPGGSTNFTIPAAVLDAMFANYNGEMLLYFGANPNGTNGIGRHAVLSRVVVSNQYFTANIDDNFSAPALNTEIWAVSADLAGGVFVVPAGSLGWLTWTLPDTGFRFQSSRDVAEPKAWSEPAVHTFVNRNIRQALIEQSYDSELLRLSPVDSTLPEGIGLRESPIAASLGQTTIRALPGGQFRINSSMLLWLDVSIDGANTWLSALNGAVPMVLTGTFETNSLPPQAGQYVSSAGWAARYPGNVIITNLVIGNFSDSFAPPGPQPANPINADVSGEISLDGGATFTPFTTAATIELRSLTSGQRYYRLMKPGS